MTKNFYFIQQQNHHPKMEGLSVFWTNRILYIDKIDNIKPNIGVIYNEFKRN